MKRNVRMERMRVSKSSYRAKGGVTHGAFGCRIYTTRRSLKARESEFVEVIYFVDEDKWRWPFCIFSRNHLIPESFWKLLLFCLFAFVLIDFWEAFLLFLVVCWHCAYLLLICFGFCLESSSFIEKSLDCIFNGILIFENKYLWRECINQRFTYSTKHLTWKGFMFVKVL